MASGDASKQRPVYVRIYQKKNQLSLSGQKRKLDTESDTGSYSYKRKSLPAAAGYQCASTSSLPVYPQFASFINQLARIHSQESRQIQLQDFYKKSVCVSDDDKQYCRGLVWDTIKTILNHVQKQEGGYVYNCQMEKAGSTSIDTKIGKADEFDWIVPVKASISSRNKYLGGKFCFITLLKDDLNKMTMDLPLTTLLNEFEDGSFTDYALRTTSTKADIPDNIIGHSYVLSRLIKQDLHLKIKRALSETGLSENVTLANDAHGPALTLTIRPGERVHYISVDITISIPTDHPVELRTKTMQVFSPGKIREAKDAGMHCVPKWSTAFDLSYSKVERALLKGIDGEETPGGCRKRCHKVIKKYVQEFQQSRDDKAPGISSHIFKHQLLWMHEDHYGEEGYWDQQNFGERVIDMLEDCENRLRQRNLPDYFVIEKNILEGKSPQILTQLADHFRGKRQELENM